MKPAIVADEYGPSHLKSGVEILRGGTVTLIYSVGIAN